ncbi:hypothetical protein QMK19_38640 [Streptomyces sp. H10-C2]|uniref:hypothetical protein n=1 Tax=unclassified Streptomyces TaxID=2593676 RepID=UPI0024BBA48D|nr:MULTISPECIES: hypothetical protein [unclassified Streptomyces]MDJ0346817.1 hypothetical protein [Streptomyces sp. PH10-H1]MDJ0375358.1 hypothetical protein [Streptomyces sp. H10-C2]
MRRRIGRAAAVGVLGLSVAGSALALAPSAQAYSTGYGTISCSAVKVHRDAGRTSTTVGIAYRHDKIAYDQFAYRASERTWYTRATVTRADGKKIRGYMLYDCANPYNSNPAPKPPIPR